MIYQWSRHKKDTNIYHSRLFWKNNLSYSLLVYVIWYQRHLWERFAMKYQKYWSVGAVCECDIPPGAGGSIIVIGSISVTCRCCYISMSSFLSRPCQGSYNSTFNKILVFGNEISIRRSEPRWGSAVWNCLVCNSTLRSENGFLDDLPRHS